MKTTTKAQTVIRWRLDHHKALEQIGRECGMPEPDGLALWRKLRRIENAAGAAATAQCNGEAYGGQPFREEAQWEEFKEQTKSKVAAVFGGRLPEGFFFNGDPRGYALKIERAKLPEGMHRDWGSYGCLAAEIN